MRAALLLGAGAASAARVRSCPPSAKTPAPPAPRPPPVPPPSPHTYASRRVLDAANSVVLSWTLDKAAGRLDVQLEADAPAGQAPGWLGQGVAPGPTMEGGSFVIGYGACVRAQTLPSGAKDGTPPNGAADFTPADASFGVAGGRMTLRYSRDVGGKIGPQWVLHAAGSAAAAPASCSAALSNANFHNLYMNATLVDFEGGGEERDGSDLHFTQAGPHRHLGRHALGYDIYETTFMSPVMPLASGEIAYTAMSRTHMPMPPGTHGVLEFLGEVVDCNNESVPLDEVYNHHWIVTPNSGQIHLNPPCTGIYGAGAYVWGIGAESRTTPAIYPPGYAYVVKKDSKWGAQIHLLRTDGVSGGEQGVKECIECWYAEGRSSTCTPGQNGSFSCCEDNARCAVDPAKAQPSVDYYLQYKVKWTPDVDKITPLDVWVIRAPNCDWQYNVAANAAHPEQMVAKEYKIDRDREIVFGMGHLHTGAINLTVYYDGSFVCASYPVHGTQRGVAGDELGHLTAVTPCLQKANGTSLVVRKGKTLRVEGWYYVGEEDPRIAPTPAGAHLGVMSYLYAASAKL